MGNDLSDRETWQSTCQSPRRLEVQERYRLQIDPQISLQPTTDDWLIFDIHTGSQLIRWDVSNHHQMLFVAIPQPQHRDHGLPSNPRPPVSIFLVAAEQNSSLVLTGNLLQLFLGSLLSLTNFATLNHGGSGGWMLHASPSLYKERKRGPLDNSLTLL